MTTISHNRRQKGKGLRALLIGILCIVLAGILIVWQRPLTALFWSVFAPVFSTVQGFVYKGELEQLRSELAKAQSLVADRDFLARENAELKSRLGRLIPGETTRIAAVLMRPPATPYDTFLLDVGLNDGVAMGDLVFASGSTVLGYVSEVYRSTSRATLYSAPEETHDTLLVTQDGSAPLVVEGQGGGSFVGELPQGVPVAVGDSVIFPNITPTLAARVSAVEVNPSESFQTVYLQLPANPFALQYVEVRKP